MDAQQNASPAHGGAHDDATPSGNADAGARSNNEDEAQSPVALDLGMDHEIAPDDTDSAVADLSYTSSTGSLSSSLVEPIHENGHQYHRYKEGKYLLPNDEIEQERLDIQHHLMMMTLDGKLYIAPTTNPKNVLDIGTGTGVWATEFADRHPEANVLGIDLSPIQPKFVPPNCRFMVDDAEEEWLYSQQFDFIHGRMLCSCFKDPAAVIANAFNNLSPNGFLEMQDAVPPLRCIDDSLKKTALEKWIANLMLGAQKLGKDLTCSARYKQYMIEAGFVDVEEKHFRWPVNTWPIDQRQKELGRGFQQDLLHGLNGISMAALTRGLGMSTEEVESFLMDVRNDLKNPAIHAYMDIIVVYGRKPE